MKRINALTIAGTDPSGGAGIQADLKTFSALGAYGCSVITALVAQNTRGVQSVYRIEPDFVAAQLDSVFSDVRIDTTKIGMLAETDIVEAVAERLQRYQFKTWYSTPLCWQKAATRCFFTFSSCHAVQSIIATGFINNTKLARSSRLARRATRAHRTGNAGTRAIAVGDGLWRSANEGGHLDDEQSPDWLFTREGEQRFTAQRIMTKNTHGTGCTLSAALAALRPRHTNWADTVQEAKSWLSSALAQADTLEVGHGIGPVHHFHAWW